MICPNCKCEYIRGVTQCSDCDVALVDTLAPPAPGFADNARIVPVWRGNDSSERERVEEALESAGIPFTAPESSSSMGTLTPTDPSIEVWISEADVKRARKILDDLDDRVHPDSLSPEELESLALPETDDAEDDNHSFLPSDLSEHWFEDDPVAVVWGGENEEFAHTLVACLREVGIASHNFSEDGNFRLVVPAEQEARAREVVREVVEASPPE
jgi:hypothetical protein